MLGTHLLMAGRVPGPLADTFDRVNTAAGLGATSTGFETWRVLSGSARINSNRAVFNEAPAASPFAVVDAGTGDVDVSVGVSGQGGDAVYFRVADAANWWRLRVMYGTYTYYTTQYTYYCAYSSGTGSTTENYQIGGCSSTTNVGGISMYLVGQSLYSSQQVANTATTYAVILDKSVAGTVTQVQSQAVTATRLRVATLGPVITCYNQNAAALFSVSDAFNQRATLHGIGLGGSENTSPASALDNFSLTPVG